MVKIRVYDIYIIIIIIILAFFGSCIIDSHKGNEKKETTRKKIDLNAEQKTTNKEKSNYTIYVYVFRIINGIHDSEYYKKANNAKQLKTKTPVSKESLVLEPSGNYRFT